MKTPRRCKPDAGGGTNGRTAKPAITASTRSSISISSSRREVTDSLLIQKILIPASYILRITQFSIYDVQMVDQNERAIRRYLAYLEDPRSAVDDEHIAELEKQFETTVDPIAKLRVLSDLERATLPNADQLETDFVRHAYQWATENKIAPNAFRALGVDPELLKKAGFSRQEIKHNATGTGLKALSRPKRPVRAPVRIDRVVEIVRNQSDTFSIRDISNQSGATPATVSKAVSALLHSGELRESGPLPNQRSRGKIPTGYQLASRSSV